MEQEPPPSLEELQKRVENGDAQAMYELGWRYLFGSEETRDLEAGFHLLEKAVELGVDTAVYTLGTCYYSGLGTVPDLKKAVALFWQAFEKDCPAACASLGALYYYGWGVPRDHRTATLLLHKAAEHGIEQAKVLLGRCFFFGEGTRKNKCAGRKLIAEVEQSEASSDAWYELGNFYAKFFGKQNQRKAMAFYQKAADTGLLEARTQIASLHFEVKDFTKALDILTRPEMADIPAAKLLLARCYARGFGVEKNPEEAARLYWSDAESGDPDAEYEWGCVLDRGKYGIPQDRNEADKWLNIVAKKDYVWTSPKEENWRQITAVFLSFYGLVIPFLLFAFWRFGMYEKTFDSPKNILDNASYFLFWLPAFLLYVVGVFWSLRCARWGSALTAFVSVDIGFTLLIRTVNTEPLGICVFHAMILGFAILFPLSACVMLAQRTYWRERKFHERRISFTRPIQIGAMALIAFQILRYFVV